MWDWLWPTTEEAAGASEGRGQDGAGNSRGSGRRSSRGGRSSASASASRRQRRSRRTTASYSAASSSAQSSFLSSSSAGGGGVSTGTVTTPSVRSTRQSHVVSRNNNKQHRNPTRTTRGRPHFPSTFSVGSGHLSNQSGLSSSDSRPWRRRQNNNNNGDTTSNNNRSRNRNRGTNNRNTENHHSRRHHHQRQSTRSSSVGRTTTPSTTTTTENRGNTTADVSRGSRGGRRRSRSHSYSNNSRGSTRRSRSDSYTSGSRGTRSRSYSYSGSSSRRSYSPSRRSRSRSRSRGSRGRLELNIRVPRSRRINSSSRRSRRRRQSADSVSSLGSGFDQNNQNQQQGNSILGYHMDRIKQSFLGAIEDITEQIQMTIAENENDEYSSSASNDDDTIRYDNTGRISLQPANPQQQQGNSVGNSGSYWSDSEFWDDDDIVFSRAISAMRFAIFADAINSQVLGPNYALLVETGIHNESFPTTEPFDFASAYYFIPMCADVGMVLSSVVMGYLSDKRSVGRTRCVLACMYFGALGSVLKYLARNNFWTFCMANFFTGLFGGSLAVGMAYVSDIFLDRMQTDAEIGLIVATNMIGRTGGGIIAIAMQKVGLFEPLLVSAGISFVAGLLCHMYMCDVIPWDDEDEEDYNNNSNNNNNSMVDAPDACEEGMSDVHPSSSSIIQNEHNNDSRQQQTEIPSGGAMDHGTETSENKPSSRKSQEISTASESLDMTLSYIEEEDENYPTELDPCALFNVILGELADNLGSIGLVPICLAPLMWQTFHADFVEAEPPQEPIMSESSYKWIYVFVALIVIPGAIIAPVLFARLGPALCAVLANLLTGAITMILLQIANIEPPTFATYCIFVTVLYSAFPLTVISQLSTGPMLDRIAPIAQRGQIQGLNMAAMNTATAVGPFVYGILADATSVDITLYVTSGVSVVAAIINYQMVGDERFGPQTEEEDDDDFYSDGDDLMSGMDPSSSVPPGGTASDHLSSRRSLLPSTATRSVASLAHELHVEFLPSFF